IARIFIKFKQKTSFKCFVGISVVTVYGYKRHYIVLRKMNRRVVKTIVSSSIIYINTHIQPVGAVYAQFISIVRRITSSNGMAPPKIPFAIKGYYQYIFASVMGKGYALKANRSSLQVS